MIFIETSCSAAVPVSAQLKHVTCELCYYFIHHIPVAYFFTARAKMYSKTTHQEVSWVEGMGFIRPLLCEHQNMEMRFVSTMATCLCKIHPSSLWSKDQLVLFRMHDLAGIGHSQKKTGNGHVTSFKHIRVTLVVPLLTEWNKFRDKKGADYPFAKS